MNVFKAMLAAKNDKLEASMILDDKLVGPATLCEMIGKLAVLCDKKINVLGLMVGVSHKIYAIVQSIKTGWFYWVSLLQKESKLCSQKS